MEKIEKAFAVLIEMHMALERVGWQVPLHYALQMEHSRDVLAWVLGEDTPGARAFDKFLAGIMRTYQELPDDIRHRAAARRRADKIKSDRAFLRACGIKLGALKSTLKATERTPF